jgi:hypothetical protein
LTSDACLSAFVVPHRALSHTLGTIESQVVLTGETLGGQLACEAGTLAEYALTQSRVAVIAIGAACSTYLIEEKRLGRVLVTG